MNIPWYLESPETYAQMRAEIEAIYPDLKFSVVDDLIILQGNFPIIEGKVVLDRFNIEIKIPKNFPEDLPVVREIGGRIPWTADRHVDEYGASCLFVPDERWRFFPKDATLAQFLNGPVRNYFIGQSLFERTGNWPFGQRCHGIFGIFEAYSEMLNIPLENIKVLTAFIDIISRKEVKGHWLCLCESGKILRKCHWNKILELREKISAKTAERSLERIKEGVDHFIKQAASW